MKGMDITMKKVLLLGGSAQQIPSILTAKKLGYYTITCDYLPENPGHKYADEYFNISTTDKEAVLELAIKLQISGIVCYASDPAASTAAYVAEKMGLPTNPYKSVEILANKDLFREFLQKNNFCTPLAKGFSSKEKAFEVIKEFKFPILVKPVDSSGSKGVALIKNEEELSEKIDGALVYSRCKRFILEEYVEKYGYQVAGDGFSVNGKLVFRCFANDHFDAKTNNPFVPVAASFPYFMPERVHEKIHQEIQRLMDLLHLTTGAYNYDIRIDKDENVYLMEVGPRNGGNYIPQVIQYATGVDMVEYTIKAAMGEDVSELRMVEQNGYWAYYSVHSYRAGKLKEIHIDANARKNNIIESYINYKEGDMIPDYTGSGGTLGIILMKFDSMEQMLDMMDHSDKWIEVIVE